MSGEIDLLKLTRGLYLLSRPKGLVTHVALLDVGNILGLQVDPRYGPVVIHRLPNGLSAEYLSMSGGWETVVGVRGHEGVRARVFKAFEDPTYDLFERNCEHFVTHTLSGEAKSPQLSGALGFIAVVAVIGLLMSD